MNSAFAHEQVYPHIHPHQPVSHSTDLLLTALYVAGLVFATFLLMKIVIAVVRQIRDKR
jgi:hypothetical protein